MSLSELEAKFTDLQQRFSKVKQLNEILSQQAKESFLLFDIAQQITLVKDAREYRQNLDQVFSKYFSVNEYGLFLKSSTSDLLTVGHSFGLPKTDLKETFYRPNEGLVGKVFQKQQTIYIPDTRVLKKYLYYNDIMNVTGSLYYLPLIADNKSIGVFKLRKYSTDGFTSSQRSLLPNLQRTLSETVKQIFSQKQELHGTFVDEITSLYNHNYFRRQYDIEFKRAQRYGHELSMIAINLDGIRNNDSKIQTLFLKKFSGALLKALRISDLAVRNKRNQIIVILPETTQVNAKEVIEKINEVFLFARREVSSGNNENRFDLQLNLVNYPNDSIEPKQILNLLG